MELPIQNGIDEYARITKHEAGHYIANRVFCYVPTSIQFSYNNALNGYSGGCVVTYNTIYQKRIFRQKTMFFWIMPILIK